MADMKRNNGEKNYRKNPEQNSCGSLLIKSQAVNKEILGG